MGAGLASDGGCSETHRMNRTLPESRQPLRARSLMELLNETFAIYARRFWRLSGLVAAIQVPVSLVSLALAVGLSAGAVAFVAGGLIGFGGIVFVYGAVAMAVGQHYVNGQIDIRRCLSRTWWRVVSLSLLAAVMAPLFFLTAVVFLILAVPAIMLVTLPVQPTVLEGSNWSAALRRSWTLVRGSGWRVVGIALSLGFVAFGLTILVYLPFFLASLGTAPGDATVLSVSVQILGGLIAAVVVPAVLAISGTLLYYDLRVRKENYDFRALSREMDMVAA